MAHPMQGKVVIVTGGSAGIGLAAARSFAASGAKVVLTGRSAATLPLAAQIGAEGHLVDYADLDQIRAFAALMLDRHPRIDVLANNAGGAQDQYRLTRDGHEMTFQVNHLAGFLLTELLRDRIAQSGGRVINTASAASLMSRLDLTRPLAGEQGFSALGRYNDSKLMNILHAQELARRAPNLPVAAFHPGVVATDLGRDGTLFIRLFYSKIIAGLFMKTPAQGADTLIWLAGAQPGKAWQTGGYYDKRRLARLNPRATPQAGRDLWDISVKLLGL